MIFRIKMIQISKTRKANGVEKTAVINKDKADNMNKLFGIKNIDQMHNGSVRMHKNAFNETHQSAYILN